MIDCRAKSFTLGIFLILSFIFLVKSNGIDGDITIGLYHNNASVPLPIQTPTSTAFIIPTGSKKVRSRGKTPKVPVIFSAEQHSRIPTISASINSNLKAPGQAKQSWLSVASAVAHSTAAGSDSSQSFPVGEETHKPTKYHYYPYNQHLYLLPECATQQVCSAVYLRLNYSQPLCACPTTHQPCSVSTRTDDQHTIPLVTGSQSQILTLVKTCEPTDEVRECRAPKDWSILALQNTRTGKAHYLVICRCPSPGYLEGPIPHSQPAYARVPGIRVYGMTCVRIANRTGKKLTTNNVDFLSNEDPPFPWHKLKIFAEKIASEKDSP